MSDDNDFQPKMSRGVALIGIGAAGFAGLLVGVVAHAMLAPTKIEKSPPEVIKQELTEAELTALCDDTTKDVRDSLGDAHQKVLDLQSQLDAKEAELDQMKADAEKDASKKAAAVEKWKAMESEVSDLRIKLSQAEEERDQLMVQLKDTVAKLEYEIGQKEKAVKLAKKYKTESVQNLWKAFTSDAKVQICDRGTRKRHENCYEAVDAALAPDSDKFTTCVDKHGIIPVLKQGEPKEALPAHAEWLNPDSKFMTEGMFTKESFFVIFCDPTLPEATLAEDADNIPL